MNDRDRKQAIMLQLGKEAEPITLAELAARLHFEKTSKTLHRSLNELIQEGLVKKEGQTKGARYITVKREAQTAHITSVEPQPSSCFGSESLTALEKVGKPLYERKPVSYNSSWLDSYHPNKTFYLSQKRRGELLIAGQRASKHDPAGTYAHQIFNRLLIDLSYNSSRLEGNTYSLLETERLLLHGDTPEGKLEEEKVMIINHKEAIRFLVEHASQLTVQKETICTLHYLLADGLIESQYAGKVRSHAVRIGGSTYIPFENKRKLEEQLQKITKKAAEIKDPFEQSLFLLIHISYLQAFEDVNKRTARLAANIPLIRENLVPLAFSDIPVKDYMSAIIAIYELQDVRPLVDLFTYSYIRTCAAYDSTVKALGFDEVRVRFRQERKALIRKILLSLNRSPLGLIKKETTKLIPKTAQEDFIQDVLEDLELLDESRIAGLGITSDEFKKWKGPITKKTKSR